MINFIICEDNKNTSNKICMIIDKVMIKNNYDYKKHCFYDYDKNFYKLLNRDLQNKIYLLDIEMPTSSGIDIAREIRKNDINSIINFITGHNEIGGLLLKERIMFLSFICKFDDMEKQVQQTIKESLKLIGLKQAIRFEESGILYTILLSDILYITTDTISRKTIIITKYAQFRVNRSMKLIVRDLDDRFLQTHRACFVNTNRVVKFDKRKNVIHFEDRTINLLSNNYKKGIDNVLYN